MSRPSEKCRALDPPQGVQGPLTTIVRHAVAHHCTTQYVHAREQTESFRDCEPALFGHTQKQGFSGGYRSKRAMSCNF
jgi:hypothetical protein